MLVNIILICHSASNIKNGRYQYVNNPGAVEKIKLLKEKEKDASVLKSLEYLLNVCITFSSFTDYRDRSISKADKQLQA